MQKSVMIGILGTAIVVLAVGMSMLVEDVNAPQTQPPTAPAATQAPPTIEAIILPTFDVVRVDPDGHAIMAGRAKPESTVEILDSDDIFGSVITDPRGEWVYVPGNALSPGDHRLGLRMLRPGKDPLYSDHVVLLSVPDQGKDAKGTLVVKVRRDGTGASQVLQKPGEETRFDVDSIDYGDGKLIISGHAIANKVVHLYVDNRFIGRTVSDEDKGLWSLSPSQDIAPGTYTLRADMLDDKGNVLARRELPFQRADLSSSAAIEANASGNFFVIQPGNSLWRLARQTYGNGLRYHDIFEANRDLIKNPDLIYPGQVFQKPSD